MSAVTVHHGDSRDVLKSIADSSIDACVCDPPYALVSIVKRFGGEGAAAAKSNGASGVYRRASAGFMNVKWDTGETAFDPAFWVEVLRVLKPGGHVVAFSGTRTYHRLACAIEDAGFEIRDMGAWLYGSGFPKSHDVSKGIDKAAGAERTEVVGSKLGRPGMAADGRNQTRAALRRQEGRADLHAASTDITAPATEAARQWAGWGTALKPALEPIVLARKPLDGTVAANVLAHGTGALNIDGCRVDGDKGWPASEKPFNAFSPKIGEGAKTRPAHEGRWPANVVLSWPEDEFAFRSDVTAEQKREVFRWLHENT